MDDQILDNQVDGSQSQQQTGEPLPGKSSNLMDMSHDNKLEQRVAYLEKRASDSNRWMVLLTGITAVIALAGVAISFSQWKTTQSLFYQDQRPYVDVIVNPIEFGPDMPIAVNVLTGNAGKSPALKVGGRGHIFLGANALQDAYHWFDTEAPKTLPSHSGAIIPPGTHAKDIEAIRTTISTASIGKNEFEFLTGGIFRIVVAYRTTYVDHAGNQYWIDTCVGYGGPQSILNCPEHNDVQ
jgi:hypothetical protein